MNTNLIPGQISSNYFRQLEGEYHEIIKLPPNSSEAISKLNELLEKFEILWDHFRRGQFYSKNEDIDEYSTSTLKYFLIPFYIGRLHTLFQGQSRPSHLETSITYFDAFSDQMTQFKLVEKERPLPNNPNERRERIIIDFKERKELENKIQKINDLTKNEERGILGDRVDEELERELVMDLLKLSVIESRSFSRSCNDELPFAKMRAEGIKPEEPKNPPPKIWFQRIDREQARKSVFAPLEDVMPRELPPDDETFASTSDKKKPELDASDEEEREAARKEASRWDDWKDDHPPFSQM